MFTAHMINEKIAEELLAETRSPQRAFLYAINKEKEIEHSKTMKTNPFGLSKVSPTIKQEPLGCIYLRGRGAPKGYQNNQRGRDFGRG